MNICRFKLIRKQKLVCQNIDIRHLEIFTSTKKIALCTWKKKLKFAVMNVNCCNNPVHSVVQIMWISLYRHLFAHACIKKSNIMANQSAKSIYSVVEHLLLRLININISSHTDTGSTGKDNSTHDNESNTKRPTP